jgi:hypothetical protein
MAGKNAILHAAAMKRKSQVRAAIIHGRDLAVMGIDGDRPIGAADHDDAFLFEFR